MTDKPKKKTWREQREENLKAGKFLRPKPAKGKKRVEATPPKDLSSDTPYW